MESYSSKSPSIGDGKGKRWNVWWKSDSCIWGVCVLVLIIEIKNIYQNIFKYGSFFPLLSFLAPRQSLQFENSCLFQVSVLFQSVIFIVASLHSHFEYCCCSLTLLKLFLICSKSTIPPTIRFNSISEIL